MIYSLYRASRTLRRRMHSCAAIGLLVLYAAAAWHGLSHHHPAAEEAACGSCGAHACAPDASPGPAPPAPAQDGHLESHACALCTLLHAPATPGISLAAPAPPLHGAVYAFAPAARPASAPIGGHPCRAPPFRTA